jgi:S1-C subfamily serine protease
VRKAYIGFLFGLAAMASALSPLSSRAGYEDLFAQAKDASWAIYTRGTGGMQASCSATAIRTDEKRTHLLTAGHCFLGIDLKRTDFLVTQDHFNFYPANIFEMGLKLKRGMQETSTDLDHYYGDDWAVVEAKVGKKPIMPLGKAEDLRIGQDILVVGVPFGMDFLAVQGIVGSLDLSLSKLVWNHYYGANVFVAGGNSGSGVISAKQKAVIGIVDAGPGAQSSMMIFMPTSKLPKDLWSKLK